MSDRPGMTDLQFKSLTLAVESTMPGYYMSASAVGELLRDLQAEWEAATKPTQDEVFRARGEAVERRKGKRRVTTWLSCTDPLNRLRRNFLERRQPPTESEVMPNTRRSEPLSSRHDTATPPTPQPEGESRLERLHNLIVAKTQHSLWTAYGLADAILADLAASLSEAEVERLAYVSYQTYCSTVPYIPAKHMSSSLLDAHKKVVRAIAAELGKGAEAADITHTLDELRADTKTAEARIAEVEAERDRLRTALEWYANKGNYHHVGRHQDHPISNDYGDRARAALREGVGHQKPDTTDITRDAELGRMVRRMVHLKRIIKLSHHLGLGGAPIFSAANIFGPESGLGNTLDEAVAALVAKLGKGK